MTLQTSRRVLIGLLAVALSGVVASSLLVAGSGPGTSASPAPSTSTPGYELAVSVGRVWGRGPDGPARPRQLRAPTRAIRRAFTDLYETAFVDPARWAGGRFPGLEAFFAASARFAAREDLNRLTLGRAARRLDAVRPRRARLDLRFVLDGGGHAVVAFADMRFTAVGLSGDVGEPISQRGRFALRRLHGAWRIESYDVSGRIPAGSSRPPRRRSARFVPGPPTSRPMFVLVIGSDARPGQTVTASRADALHIVAVNPALGRGTIVGIPRDSYVAIPGHGTAKINAALAYGGPDLVVRTVEGLTGVRIDAYLLAGFDGFRRAVDAIGGIDVRVPYAMSDPDSGAHFRPGPTHLGGREALAFGRDRHDAPGGDLGRSINQGRVLLATLRSLREALARDPARLVPWLVGASRFIRTDLSLAQMTELLLAASTFEPRRVRNVVVFGHGDTVGGQSIVRLGSEAFAVFRDVARDGVIGG